ncbi:magnesium transporter NIPA-domain-containing protein [Zopfochytrium polystomum]|nr:magnesium transporter NIPA-domain-containing protein [Zopfochytrium polystomum]
MIGTRQYDDSIHLGPAAAAAATASNRKPPPTPDATTLVPLGGSRLPDSIQSSSSVSKDGSMFAASPSPTALAVGSAAATAADVPSWHKVVGITLAVSSAVFIGASFVLKKRGLLDANVAEGKKPGEGYGYLKNALWWTGLIMMLFGEVCNMAAYAFSPAIIVTPMGAGSVVISAIMSDIFLKERLNFTAKIGCAQCVLGAVLLALNGPSSNATTTLASFWKLAIDPVFQAYLLANVAVLIYLIFYAAKKWGDRYPMVYISICSLIGGFVVTSMQGLGSAVVYTASNPNDNQFKNWSMYPLIMFVLISGVLQINYLNKALNIYSTAVVTPIYYVCFTTATLLCSAVLFREFNFPSAIAGVSCLIGFLVIIGGVALLFAYSLKLSKEATAEGASLKQKEDAGSLEALAPNRSQRGPPPARGASASPAANLHAGYRQGPHRTDSPDAGSFTTLNDAGRNHPHQHYYQPPPGQQESVYAPRSAVASSIRSNSSPHTIVHTPTGGHSAPSSARPSYARKGSTTSVANLLDDPSPVAYSPAPTPTPTPPPVIIGNHNSSGSSSGPGAGAGYAVQQQQPPYELGYRQPPPQQQQQGWDAFGRQQQLQGYTNVPYN